MNEIILIILISILIVLCISILLFLILKKNTVDDSSKEMEKQVFDGIKKDIIIELQKQMSDLSEKTNNKFEGNNKFLSDGIVKIIENLQLSTNQVHTSLNSYKESMLGVVKGVTDLESKLDSFKSLNSSITQLNNVLANQKTRGNFGEYNLAILLKDIFGEDSSVFELQKQIKPHLIPDATIKINDKLKLCIDSKFTYGNFKKYFEAKDPEEKKAAKASLITTIKDEIKVITKYIITNVTPDYAILFFPFDSLYNEVSINFEEITSYARKNKILLTSPSTLIPILNTLNQIRVRENRKDNLNVVIKNIESFKVELTRFQTSIQTSLKSAKQMNENLIDSANRTEKALIKLNKVLDANDDVLKSE